VATPTANLPLVQRAAAVADVLLATLGLEVTKRLDLATPAGFEAAVAALAAHLRHAAAKPEADAMRDAVRVLDVDWRVTTADQRRRLVDQALVAAGRQLALVPTRIHAPLGDAGRAVVTAARRGQRAHGLAIGAAPNAVDRRLTDHIVRSTAHFVRDANGRRLEALSRDARGIVAAGLERGLGRKDLARELQAAAERALVQRAPFYWEVVAGAFVGKSRSFAHLSSMAEAGITHYRIEATLDAATTPICRHLHGTVFSVSTALEHANREAALENPDDIRRVSPWVRQRGDQLVVDHVGGRVALATVIRIGVSADDDRGEVRGHVTTDRLQAIGINCPPFHALCRTTIVPHGQG
jgi:SPP1 gp7 family putative phage head morphogenesis protein